MCLRSLLRHIINGPDLSQRLMDVRSMRNAINARLTEIEATLDEEDRLFLLDYEQRKDPGICGLPEAPSKQRSKPVSQE